MDRQTRHILIWLGFWLCLILALYWLREILLPFLAGAAIAYLLDPVADRFEAGGMSRTLAVILILGLFMILSLSILVVVLPILTSELRLFLQELPSYIDKVREIIAYYGQSWFGLDPKSIEGNTEQSIRDYLNKSSGQIGNLLQQLLSSGMALVTSLSLFVVTPVVAFYLLLDWDHMVAKVDGWLPLRDASAIRDVSKDIDKTISGFLRGQFLVCLLLASFYAIGLSLFGLKNGLFIGVIAGLLSFIPYVGSIVGFLAATLMALSQFWPEWGPILGVMAVFFSGQFLEGNVLQPKIVGSSVSLHPVWLMFALFFFGYFMGFLGMLIAVPLAASIGVVVRYGLTHYLKSDFYLGKDVEALEMSSQKKTDHGVQNG